MAEEDARRKEEDGVRTMTEERLRSLGEEEEEEEGHYHPCQLRLRWRLRTERRCFVSVFVSFVVWGDADDACSPAMSGVMCRDCRDILSSRLVSRSRGRKTVKKKECRVAYWTSLEVFRVLCSFFIVW